MEAPGGRDGERLDSALDAGEAPKSRWVQAVAGETGELSRSEVRVCCMCGCDGVAGPEHSREGVEPVTCIVCRACRVWWVAYSLAQC